MSTTKNYGTSMAVLVARNAVNDLVKRICEMAADVQAIRGGTRMDLKIVRGAVGISFHKKGLFDEFPHFSIESKDGHSINPCDAPLPMLTELIRELAHILT